MGDIMLGGRVGRSRPISGRVFVFTLCVISGSFAPGHPALADADFSDLTYQSLGGAADTPAPDTPGLIPLGARAFGGAAAADVQWGVAVKIMPTYKSNPTNA